MSENKNVWESHNVAKRARIGATLYLKVNKARIQKDISPTSDTLAIVLVGEELVWHGAHETDKRFHKVSFTVTHSRVQHNPLIGTTVTGYIFGSNLSVSPPDMKLVPSNKGPRIDSKGFVASGSIKA
jgi:hypothetical protein